ncbi:amidophosphoribosyltransferase [Pseudoalteromonas sp. KS88]|uniref:ComF family protein n=1 Tax=Pseudoalteromonas sp. KS88 TaxID=2109918 RepID=UPI0010806E5C|nr:phosphoribosyltransferase family protein [Pseudoalteromonas sp. KS88]TGE81016.1 amidophosphoribosyltransferase [Pseudoalteromonas sp. KS88]
MTSLNNQATGILDWFFPSFCVRCKIPVSAHVGICQHCLTDLPLFDLSTYPNLLYRPDIAELFPDCQFDHLMACAWYRPPFDGWLSQLKFSNQIFYKNVLQQIITQQVSTVKTHCEKWPELFIIMPLHHKRFLQRGYNQVAQTWINCLPTENVKIDYLVRHKKTNAQSSLTKAKRIKNLQDAFICHQNLEGKTVAVVDDVMTTGATLNAATVALKKAGAKQVWAFVTCLTPLGH